MIGFNGQYLSAAAIGDMRITAMSQGDKWLIAPWHVSASAATAIMSSFGAEGAGVIQAANAYLNGLATTDREKAQALAGFINEDPMMVCSLGLQDIPIRIITSSGSGYLRTSVKENNIYGLKFGMRVNGNRAAWSSYVGGTLDNFTIGSANTSQLNAYIRFRTVEITQSLPTTTNRLSEYEFIDGKIKVDGTQIFTYSDTPFSTESSTYITLGNNGNGSRPNYCSFSHAEIYDSNNNEHKYLPIIRQGTVGMVEIQTGELATISGTWTIEYTLPDGTPWTPLTDKP